MSSTSWATCVLGVLGASLVACGGGTNEPGTGRTYWIVTHSEPENSFWGPLVQGMQDAAEQRGATAEFLGAPNPDVPPAEQQARFIRDAIQQGIDGIGVTLSDLSVLAPPIREALAAGMPVVSVNIPVEEQEFAANNLPVLTYVGQIETVTAAKAALHALDLIEADGGTMDVALCLGGSMYLPWSVQRCEGMRSALEPLGVEVHMLAGEFFAQPPDVPTTQIETWFMEHPEVDFVFTTATPPLGLALSLQSRGLIGDGVILGSVDLNEETLDAIRTGRCAFAVDQQPYMQGYMAIQILDLSNELALQPGADIQTGPFFVEQDNVDDIALLVSQGLR